MANKTAYLDIRGNHDTFDVSDYTAPDNMFATHSRAGALGHPSSYVTTVTRGNTSVAFVAMDASLNPGPKKVYNFLGHLTEDKLEKLVELKSEAEKSDYQVQPREPARSDLTVPRSTSATSPSPASCRAPRPRGW